MMSNRVVIVGGGPAGACAAGLLAKEGIDVTVLEKADFPRHHVGESLQPSAISLLDRHLDLAPQIASAKFARKYGAVYVWGQSREPWSVLFDSRLESCVEHLSERELLEGDYEHTYQVDRARFDEILLTEARRRGAKVRFGVNVAHPICVGDKIVGVTTSDGEQIYSDHVIDASGQRCLVGRYLKLTRMVSDLQFTATYGYYDGAGGFAAPLGRHVQWVVTLPDGWAWFIPISPERTSIGIVNRARKRLTEEQFSGQIQQAGFPVSNACPVTSPAGGFLHFARNWSFTNKQMAGPGWTLAGDAAAFVDPILSGGVDFAVRSGFRAALAALRVFDSANSEVIAREYDAEFRGEYNAYLRLARYWYGNNRSVDGLFWQAHREIPSHATATPLRAFVYLTTGKYAAEQHVRVFQEWQEKKMFSAIGIDEDALRRARARKKNALSGES